MAKPVRRRDVRRKSRVDERLPLTRENYIIIGVALLVIIAGYIAMIMDRVEGFLPLVLAPILLVIGYCVLVPLGILYRPTMFKKKPVSTQESTTVTG